MLIAHWILEITDALMYKIVYFLDIGLSVIKKNCTPSPRKLFLPPPHPQNVPTASTEKGREVGSLNRNINSV